MFALSSLPRWIIDTIRTALILAVGLTVFSVYSARGTNHDETYFACLYAGSLSQVNTTAPPANCGRGSQIEWTSFGGTIDASMIEDGSIPGSVIQDGTLHGSAIEDGTIESAKLNEELQYDIKCGAFAHPGHDFSDCDLRGAYLAYANLAGANLADANLVLANLASAILIGADLGDADLASAILIGADLGGADLTSATLIGADLGDADLTSANLNFANLRDANLFGANLTDANLSGVIWNNTTCPDGTNSDAADGDGFTCLNNL
ncbi:MAG TPA: pentapeptide repeat-containing protein [Thermomicrobiales bacterium]|nr:pentapeptide repeat-containing protein [Thermomicrobiales bacterium]